MALQTKTFTWGSYDYQSESRSYVLELILTENSVNQSANTSNISYELLLHSGSNNRFTGQIDSVLTLNGVQVDTDRRQISAQYNASWTLLQGTADVKHDDDGSLDMPIGVSIDTSNSYAPPDTTLSWNWNLTDIPRESAFGAITGTTLGNTMRVNIKRASASFIHRVYYYKGNNVWSAGNSGATYVDIPLPLSLAELSPDSKTFDLRLLLRTYDGSTQVGRDVTKYVTVTIPENEQTKPTVTMELSAVSPVEGLYIQGLSQVRSELGGLGKFGASIENYSLSIDGRSCSSSNLSGTLNTAGEIAVIGSVTDSRGFTGENEQIITVLPYYIPRLPVAEAYRVKVTKTESEDGSAQEKIEVAEDGEYLRIKATRNYAPVVSADGVQHNFCTIKYRYKPEGATTYSAEVDILAEDAESDSVETEPLLNATFSGEINYVVQIIAIDTMGNKTISTIQVPSADVYMHRPAGGTGMGLGGYVQEQDMLDVYWNVNARKALTAKSLNFHGNCNDADQATVTGIYILENGENAPYPQGLLVVFNGSVDGSATAPIFQLLMSFSGKLAARYCAGGTPQSWKVIT